MIKLDGNTAWMLLVRHGATAHNLQRPPRLQGRTVDGPLDGVGLQQARRTAAWLADQPIAAVYSSPLLRARQTAEMIAASHGLGVETVGELTEADVGRWEGRPWNEIQRDYPAEYHGFVTDAGVNPYLGGENLTQVRKRSAPALRRVLSQNPGGVIAVVAHNVVNRVFLADLLGLPLRAYRSVPQENGGVNLVRWRDGKLKLLTINSVLHLGDAAR
ncbi:MAG: histidine phosphatase family protein [Pirellulales bacterium]